MIRLDVYGRYQLDVAREDGGWCVYRVGEGTRVPVPALAIPDDVDEDGLGPYLEDLLHEEGSPGAAIKRIR